MAAFAATASVAAERHPLDPRRLAARRPRVRARALACRRGVWFGRRIGISSWEALWCRYEGDAEELRAMRAWAPGFRRETWRAALGQQGVQDDELAAELGERFGEERRARHETFEDAAPVLDALRGDYRLALVTNGASCLQREKFEASGPRGPLRRGRRLRRAAQRQARPVGVRARAGGGRRAPRRRRHGRRQPGQRRRRPGRGRPERRLAQPDRPAAPSRSRRPRRDRRPPRAPRRAGLGGGPLRRGPPPAP